MLHAEAAWWRAFDWPWNTLLHPANVVAYVTPMEQWLTVIFVGGALLALWRLPSVSLGLYALLGRPDAVHRGAAVDGARYAVAIPVFVVLAQLGKRPTVDKAITIVAPMAQALLFFVWCLFYLWREAVRKDLHETLNGCPPATVYDVGVRHSSTLAGRFICHSRAAKHSFRWGCDGILPGGDAL